MKKGARHFLGRKNRSLFDTNIQIKDTNNVDWVMDSPAIPESGTASVRARPTVKHHASSDSFQGFAVPTPKVPLLPTVNGLKANGSVGEDRWSNGSVLSTPDLMEGELVVPPPPSIAPPPPPGTFIPPPPDFMGDLNSLDLYAAKPTPQAHFMEEDFVFLKPPPMAPPKPPSTCSSGSASSIVSSPPAKIPEHPNFSPAMPPTDKQHKTFKTPPQKPIRLSSMSNLDLPPQTPAPPPPEHTPTRSSFNPHNTAKLFTVPQHSILSGYNSDQKPKQMLLLEESGSVKSAQVRAQVDAKVSTPASPVSRDALAFNESIQTTQPSPPSLPASNKEIQKATVSAQQVITKPLPTPPQKSPELLKVNSSHVSETSKDTLEDFPGKGHRFSPLLDRKLRNLKISETHGAREGPAASPLALLKAAKEREKHRPTNPLSRENSGKKNEQPSTSIYQSDSSPNSFVVVPRPSSPSSLASREGINDSLESAIPIEQTKPPERSSSPALIRSQMHSSSPALNRITAAATARATDPVGQKHRSAQPGVDQAELNLPLLPPPPEFDDLEEFMEPPPSIPPPEPPMKKPTAPPVSLHPRAPVLPPSSKPAPPTPPKLPPASIEVKPKPRMPPPQPPSSLSPSQATLLSILQKKMLEMDHKMTPTTEAESSSDDWGTPLSNESNKVPVVPRAAPQSKSSPTGNKTASLDMQELQSKVAKKYEETSSLKVPTSNGRSKHQYGMTFTVRPGTKQPITPIIN